MTAITQVRFEEPISFDLAFVRKGLLWFGCVVLAPAIFMPDPLVVAACGFMPWVLVRIVDRPRMPPIIIFYLLFMWAEATARVLLACLAGESLTEGFYGPDVYRAFWYAMVCLIVLAGTFRIALTGMPPVSVEQFYDHYTWHPLSLFWFYFATLGLSAVLAPLGGLSGGLAQPVIAVGSLKFAALFMLFATVMSTGKGMSFLLAAVLFEVVSGFTGMFSGFKMVFVLLLFVPLTLRLPLSVTNVLGGGLAFLAAVALGLFWTAIKPEYRGMASGYSDSQMISASLTDRLGLLLRKATHPEELDWAAAGDELLKRISYIDFFGASIAATDTAPDSDYDRWRDALEHVLKPRIFFPDKAALDDTEIFVRYVRPDGVDDVGKGTSISIGFLAENYIDFGFPGMLVPVALLGLLLGLSMRYFLTRPVAWITREACVAALILAGVSAGMELSLAKFLGATILMSIVLALCLKFGYPSVRPWLSR